MSEHVTPDDDDRFEPADSAGRPWRGRTLSPQPFAGDDGTTPTAYAEAIATFIDGGRTDPEPVVDALRECRVLIPLIAELGEAGTIASGATVDKRADLSIVTVAAPDSRPVLPVFTNVAAMQAWNETARPTPVEMRRAVVAALDSGTDLVVVDPGSDTEFALRRPAVHAIGLNVPWTPPWTDPATASALGEALSGVAGIAEVALQPASAPGTLTNEEVRIVVTATEHEPEAIARLTEAVAGALSASAELIARVDSLTLTISPARESSRESTRATVGDSPRTTRPKGLFRRWRSGRRDS